MGWGAYFRKLPSEISNDSTHLDQSIIAEFNTLPQMHAILSTQDRVTVSELECALKSCKTGKACGDDSIYYEHMLYSGLNFLTVLSDLYTSMLNLSYVPSKMKCGIIVTLHKGGKKRKDNPDNYRAITLTSTILKLLERALCNRIENKMTSQLSAQQGGFQKGIGVKMTSFLLRETILHAANDLPKFTQLFWMSEKRLTKFGMTACLLSYTDSAWILPFSNYLSTCTHI